MTVRVYQLPPRFYEDHVARALPENEAAISREVGTKGHRIEVELDELGFDELMSDARYYAFEMSSAGYHDAGVIGSARATVKALETQGRPALPVPIYDLFGPGVWVRRGGGPIGGGLS